MLTFELFGSKGLTLLFYTFFFPDPKLPFLIDDAVVNS